jgi:hypothetical protein
MSADAKREMYHLVFGVCYMTQETMEMDAKSDDVTRTYVQLPCGDVIDVARAMVTKNKPPIHK